MYRLRVPGDEQQIPARIGHYEILFELARSGTAVMYVACLRGPAGFSHRLAVTVFRGGLDDRSSLRADARLAAHISHRNVVQTFDLGEEGPALFLVTELVHGVSLSQLIARLRERREALERPLAAWLIAQAARGLHFAHELCDHAGRSQQIVHRGVSPHSILLGHDGVVRVADFRTPTIERGDPPTEHASASDELDYLSPEQARGEALDRRSDLFSLGATLREVASLAPTDARDALDEIVLRCLAQDREDRPATAAVVERALRGCTGRVVGEADLARLLDTCFFAERHAFENRLRRALDNPRGSA